MKLTITKDSESSKLWILQRDEQVILISGYSSRVADIVMDLLDHGGKLTLIPEPLVGEK